MPYWRRTLHTLWFTQFIAITGFYFVSPFMPYFIQGLGITDVGEVALWAGATSSVCSIGFAVMAPVWGALSDRYGRKVMIVRATLVGSVVMAAMGFVVSVQQLVVLRLLQGVFTGTVAASTTLVAGIVPEDHRGAALGSLQTAIYLGTTLGPLVGGVLGDTFGYRQSFWLTGACLLLSGILVVFFVREHFVPAADAVAARRPGYRQALAFLFASGGMLIAILTARILLRAGMVVITPTLALFVQSLLPEGQHAALVTGLISASMAVGGALGAPIIGSLGDRWGHRRLLLASALVGVLSFSLQALAPSALWLVLGQFLAGVAEGGTLATTMALLAKLAEGGRQGRIFGLDACATGVASTVGPLMGAAIAASAGLRAPFILAAAILGAGVLVIYYRVRPASELAAVTAGSERPEPSPR